MDKTLDELKDNGKEKALKIIHSALELAGLDPTHYDLNLIRKKNQPKAAPNIQVFQTAAYLAATTLSPSATKIFLYLISMSDFENIITAHQETISEECQLNLRTVQLAIKELTENGIIIKAKNYQDKRINDYFLNPMSAWKGKTLNRKLALQKINNENNTQLHLFGETYEENVIREAEEIKAKRPNLFKELGKNRIS